jgi:hypothetical protein
MQISASNLLIAAQQPRAPQQQNLNASFTQALSSANPKAAAFMPPSFEAEPGRQGATPHAGGSAASVPGNLQDSLQAPGTRLDIRI